jgi:hypothetical protein
MMDDGQKREEVRRRGEEKREKETEQTVNLSKLKTPKGSRGPTELLSAFRLYFFSFCM